MTETYTDPFIATPNSVIESSAANAGYRGSIRFFRQYLPNTDASDIGYVLQLTGAAAADWVPTSSIVSSAALVPSGLIAAFATAAAIASGWTRYSAADGRILIGAGTTFGATFVEATNYGTAWDHNHTQTTHTHDIGHGHSGSGSASTSDHSRKTDAQISSGGSEVVVQSATHSISMSVSVSSVSSTASGGPTANDIGGASTAGGIPSRAVVWAQKS